MSITSYLRIVLALSILFHASFTILWSSKNFMSSRPNYDDHHLGKDNAAAANNKGNNQQDVQSLLVSPRATTLLQELPLSSQEQQRPTLLNEELPKSKLLRQSSPLQKTSLIEQHQELPLKDSTTQKLLDQTKDTTNNAHDVGQTTQLQSTKTTTFETSDTDQRLSAHVPNNNNVTRTSISTSTTADTSITDQKQNIQREIAVETLDTPTQQQGLPVIVKSNNNNNTIIKQNSKYAYVFMIGGCMVENTAHLGFVWDILVSTRILREQGSTADVVAFFQMSAKTKANKLKVEEERWLQHEGVIIKYLPKPEQENFVQITLQKFSILNMTEYKRVILLDGDVMPIGNMDYFFELSDKPDPLIKENVVVAGREEPANAGFFMLAPKPGEYEELLSIIKRRHEETQGKHGRARFDAVRGWGHVIQEGDEWQTKYRRGRLWNFQAVTHDQGLLWYWVKYVKKSFTHVLTNQRIQNWGSFPNGTVYMEKEYNNFMLGPYSKPRFKTAFTCNKFICDFAHFTGRRGKPWLHDPPFNVLNMTEEESQLSATSLFYYTLTRLNKEINMGLDFKNWKPVDLPNLGLSGNINQLHAMNHHEVRR